MTFGKSKQLLIHTHFNLCHKWLPEHLHAHVHAWLGFFQNSNEGNRELDCWRVIQITKWLEAIVREEECVSAIGELGFIYLSLVQTVPSVRKANGLYYYFTFHTPPSLPLNKAVILWISFILQGYQRYSVLTWFYLYTNIGGSNTFQSLLNKQIILLQWGIKILIFLLVSSRRNQL